MAVLRFSLTADATGRIYELLVCLAKFGESVSIEAKKDKVRASLRRHRSEANAQKLTLTALNLSRTAYASFALDARSFFSNYEFKGTGYGKGGERFTCQLLNKVRA